MLGATKPTAVAGKSFWRMKGTARGDELDLFFELFAACGISGDVGNLFFGRSAILIMRAYITSLYSLALLNA